MQQTTPAPAGLDRYGATDAANQMYTRVHPPGMDGLVMDTFSVSLGQFASTDAARALLPDLLDDAFAFLHEQWETVDLLETTLPTGLKNASRQLFSGTIAKRRTTYYYALGLLQVEDLVGVIVGHSTWYHGALEVAYLSDVVSSLAAVTSSERRGDVSRLLPTADSLPGGLQVDD